MTKEYEIDGSKITSLDTFYDEISRVLIPGFKWGRNLDAFNDILKGGFGTPDEGFTIKWSHSTLSKATLGRAFDELVEIIREHGPGGDEADYKVQLVLD